VTKAKENSHNAPAVAPASAAHLPMTIEWVQLANLEFDPENPRLPSSLNGSNRRAVLEWMLEDASLIELMGSVGAQGYFPGEPLLTVHSNGQYRVVEGNRRLAAAILLSDPGAAPARTKAVRLAAQEAKHKPPSLPVLNFGGRNEILDYLGYRHVTGIKEWDPLAKARYVRQLVERADQEGASVDMAQIARRIGSRRDYVEKLLAGLRVHEHVAERSYFGLEGVDQAAIDFSVLTTALSYESISQFVGLKTGSDRESPLNDENLQDLIDWSYRPRHGRTVLGESRNLRKLADVVKADHAVQALRAGASLDAAAELSEDPSVVFTEAVRAAGGNIATARSQVDQIAPLKQADMDLVDEVSEAAASLQSAVHAAAATGEG
jgi:hypothetical protein